MEIQAALFEAIKIESTSETTNIEPNEPEPNHLDDIIQIPIVQLFLKRWFKMIDYYEKLSNKDSKCDCLQTAQLFMPITHNSLFNFYIRYPKWVKVKIGNSIFIYSSSSLFVAIFVILLASKTAFLLRLAADCDPWKCSAVRFRNSSTPSSAAAHSKTKRLPYKCVLWLNASNAF